MGFNGRFLQGQLDTDASTKLDFFFKLAKLFFHNSLKFTVI
jgi:hypothetical protein